MILTRGGRSHRKGLHSGRKTARLSCFARGSVERSFSEAARQLGCSQATMSVRIQKLEETFGVRLFDRGPHEVKLTAEGRDLLPDIRALVDMQDRMYERTQTRRVIGQIRIGIAESYEASLLPGLLKYMQQKLRRRGTRHYVPAELASATTHRGAHAGSCRRDVAGGIAVSCSTPAASASLGGRPGAGTRSLDAGTRRLASEQMLLPGRGSRCASRALGIAYREVLCSDDSRVIQAAVGAGTAVTVMAEGTVPKTLSVMSASSLLPPLGKACIQLLERPGLQSEARAVVKREFIRAYQAPTTQLV